MAFCGPATAQQPQVRRIAADRIRASEAEDFAVFLRAAQQKTGVSLLIEDAPLHTRLSAEARKKLPSGLATTDDITAQVTLVAGLYDFEVIPVTPRFSIWRKRYSDAGDMPNVSFAEVRDSTRKVDNLFRAFTPPNTARYDDYFGPRRFDVVQTLTPEQAAQARTETGLPVRQLSPGQRESFWRSVMDFSTRPQRMFMGTADYNGDLLERGKLYFGYQPGLQGPPQPRHVVYFYPYRTSPSIGFSPLSDGPEPLFDTEQKSKEATRDRLAPLSLSLSALFKQFSLLPPAAVSPTPPARVWMQAEPALAQREMLFAGGFPGTKEEAALWVSGVVRAFRFETRVVPDATRARIGQNVVEVRRVPPKPLKTRADYAGFNAVIESLLPDPVCRSLRVGEERRLLREVQEVDGEYKPPELTPTRNLQEMIEEAERLVAERQKLIAERQRRLRAFYERAPTVSYGATHRLRDAIYARLEQKTAGNPAKNRVRNSDLTDREKAVFALSGLLSAASSLHDFLVETPAYIARFEEQSLVFNPAAREKEGQKQYSLGIGGFDRGTFQVYQTEYGTP